MLLDRLRCQLEYSIKLDKERGTSTACFEAKPNAVSQCMETEDRGRHEHFRSCWLVSL